jgi:phycobilisome core component
MKELVKEQVAASGVADASIVDQPFDYITRELSEKDV